MSGKAGENAYDLGTFLMRGWHELGNSLYPESQIPLRDHSGLYNHAEQRDVEPLQMDREARVAAPEMEHNEPELER